MAEETLQIKQLTSGDIIFAEGDAGDAAYIVESGIVEISKSSGHGASLTLATVKAGARCSAKWR